MPVEPIEAHPLYWPEGRPRTSWSRRKKSKFIPSFARSRDELMRELDRMGARRAILSTNIPLRNDGLPYANTREPDDPGVAVYFEYKGKPMCFACDQYKTVRENVRGIGLTIAAIRAIERYGSSDMMERAFRGFTALPEKAGEYWRDVFEIPHDARPRPDDIEKAFRMQALVKHPDKGGTMEEWQQLVTARENAMKDLGVTR
jgi:hypothetical protein